MKKKKSVLEKYISPGNRVDLREINRMADEDADGEEIKAYRSQVIDLVSDNRIEITIPMEKTKLVMLPVNSMYDLCFYAGKTLYQCYGKVIDRYKSDNLYIMLIELVGKLRRRQRREYYRFDCMMEMDSRALQAEEIKAIEQNEEKILPELPLERGIIVDISGGGLRFVSDCAYEVDSLILCRYQLGTEGACKEYRLISKVLSSKKLENRREAYEHRVQYINVNDEEREEIIKYIFGEERRLLSKQQGN